jgi:glycosyltransferase involved in cell wall biosynthesis
MKKIKVLRIITRLNVGGPAIHSVLLTRYLDPELFESVLVAGEVGENEGDMGYLAEKYGIEPKFVSGLGREISIFQDINAFFQLFALILKEKPDVIHTHLGKAGMLGRFAGAIVKFILIFSGKTIKIFHTFHGHFFYGYFGPAKTRVFKYIEKGLALLCERLIVLNKSQKDDISLKYGVVPEGKVEIIPLGFDFQFIEDSEGRGGAIKADAGLKDGEKLVGIVGRLTDIKNHRLFLLGASLYLKKDGAVPVRFIVVGDGELKKELEDYACELGIEEKVTFVGWVKEMGEVYDALDLLVLTSNNEGTPVTVIEAMAAGIPVVATAVGGVPELLGGAEVEVHVDSGDDINGGKAINGVKIVERGVIISPGDGEGLAHALSIILSGDGPADGYIKKARSFAYENFAYERLVGDISNLYLNSMDLV